MAEHRDMFGTVHTCKPVFSKADDGYTQSLHFKCGCEPLRHRFRCLGCNRWCGWCFGCADDMPTKCDDCWAEAQQ